MTLLFCDSFDHYATADFTKKYDSVKDINDMDIISGEGRNGTNCMRIETENNAYARKTFTAVQTIITGFAIKPIDSVGVYAYTEGFILFRDSAGDPQIGLYCNSNGAIEVRRWDYNDTLLAASASGVITLDNYHFVEVKLTIDNSAGAIIVKVDGIEVINETGLDTQDTANANVASVQLAGIGSASSDHSYIDDLYICDTSGSVNNDFLGDIRVAALFPSGVGNSAQFTASAGSNYECVDEAEPNGDTDYVESATAGHIDTYAFDDLPSTPETIHGVQTNICAKKTDAGAEYIIPVLRPASTDQEGTQVSLTDSYVYYSEVFETNPEDSAAWEEADINGSEFGAKVGS